MGTCPCPPLWRPEILLLSPTFKDPCPARIQSQVDSGVAFRNIQELPEHPEPVSRRRWRAGNTGNGSLGNGVRAHTGVGFWLPASVLLVSLVSLGVLLCNTISSASIHPSIHHPFLSPLLCHLLSLPPPLDWKM